jgi:hypothetical protein
MVVFSGVVLVLWQRLTHFWKWNYKKSFVLLGCALPRVSNTLQEYLRHLKAMQALQKQQMLSR